MHILYKESQKCTKMTNFLVTMLVHCLVGVYALVY